MASPEAYLQEDVRKIHNEVNQILNHIFGLTTAGVGLFGVILAWSIPKQPQGNDLGTASVAMMSAMLTHVVLVLLFLASKLLTQQLFTLTSYLILNRLSTWEKDWTRLEESNPTTYMHFQTLIFMTLGVLATVWPTMLHYAYHRDNALPLQLALPLVSAGVCAGVGAIAERSFRNGRAEALERWRSAKVVQGQDAS